MAENAKRTIKLLAYIFVPAIFGVIGYVLLYVGFRPVWDIAKATASMLTVESTPNFNPQLSDIYDPNAKHSIEPAQPTQSPDATPSPDSTHAPSVIPISQIRLPDIGQRYGNLNCDRIGLDAPVFWGDTNEILRNGVGQYRATFLPGFGRVILISGHNTTFFKCLQYMEEGDLIVFDTNYETYVYRVYRIEVFNENDLAALMNNTMFAEERETLVIYTCYPFHAISGRKTDRLVVFGERIEGKDVQWRFY